MWSEGRKRRVGAGLKGWPARGLPGVHPVPLLENVADVDSEKTKPPLQMFFTPFSPLQMFTKPFYVLINGRQP